ncbi:uncharacterized protein FIBRA_09199 [Fibroporia radiculosa]|uniref:Uncharacterized protein n=1 Tax=Fibroporia radiculosa TaxID=599839 RepID=J7S637_9APHY|nr:uncharacterized protein FIBRA_09199 [Fibroporia radiculosa]CCM06889.1 predicted protein [Fibroporia radiculosa]
MSELDKTYGVTLIGTIAASVLFGVTNIQVFQYYREYSSDHIWYKLAVAWLW